MVKMVKKGFDRSTLLVIGCGMLLALLSLFWLVRVESYEKGIYAQEVVLNPRDMQMLTRNGENNTAPILVESIDYSKYSGGKWEMESLDLISYQKIWDQLDGDRGAAKIDPETLKLFDTPKLSTVAIYVRKQVPYQKDGLNVLYQQIQFLAFGDYYRVQIAGEEHKGHWVYFYHPAIQNVVLEALEKHG